MSERPRKRRWLIWLKAAVSLALLGWLVARMVRRDGVETLTDRLVSLDVPWLMIAVALHFAAVLSGVARWRGLLDAAGLRHGFGRLLGSFLVGRFIGAFTPSTTGLDGWRLYDVGREDGQMATSAAVIGVEKLVGLIGMALVCALLIPFGGIELMGPSAPVAAAAMAGAAATGLWLIRRPAGLAWVVVRLPGAKLKGLGAKALDAVKRAELDARRTAAAVALGVLSHASLSAVFFATGRAVGVEADAMTLIVAGNAITLAVLLPVSIGGVGVREGVAVVLLASVGVSSTDAVLVALLGYLTGQVPALLGGALTILRPRVPSRPWVSNGSPSAPAGETAPG